MEFSLIRDIIGKPWLIDPLYVSFLGANIQNFVENKGTYESSFENQNDYSQNDNDKIQVININGELLKNDTNSGRIGMRSISNLISEAQNNENIKGTILIIDSPGGTVDGTLDLVDAIKKTSKPIVTVVDGMAASAGYWIAAATDKIFAQNNFAKVGSIGVMLSFTDVQPFYERQGVKFHRINADQSKDKNKMFEDILKGNYEEYRKTNLNPIADEFINSVKEMRPLSDDQFSGKTFFAKDVIGTMIDEIGSFDDAINYINSHSNSITFKNKSDMITKKQLTEITEKHEQEIADLKEEHKTVLKDLQSEIAEHEKTVKTLGEKIEVFETENKSLEKKQKEIAVENFETGKQLTAANEEIAKLKKADGADSTVISKKSDASDKANVIVSSDDASLEENIEKIADAYLS